MKRNTASMAPVFGFFVAAVLLIAGCKKGSSGTPTVTIDQSTPKTTMESLSKAIVANDTAAVKLLVKGNEYEMKTLDEFVPWANAVKKMTDAAVKRYGAEDPAWESHRNTFSWMGGVGKADLKESGNEATLTYPEYTLRPVKLVKEEGKWRVVFDTVADTHGRPAWVTKSANDTAEGILAGKYATSSDAANAYSAKPPNTP